MVVHLPPPGTPKVEIRLLGRQESLRVETRMGFLDMHSIYDRSKPQYLTLYPTSRTYLESAAGSSESLARGHLERYATSPEGDPCGWKRDVVCTAAGEEEVNGRRCRRWDAQFKNGKSGTYWVDLELRLILRALDPTFSFEIKDLKLAPLPADLFSVPSSYTRKK